MGRIKTAPHPSIIEVQTSRSSKLMRAIIAIIGRGAAPVPLAIVGALARVLSSLVMPDYAARTGPKQPVMTPKWDGVGA
jgi:hypothetical protein